MESVFPEPGFAQGMPCRLTTRPAHMQPAMKLNETVPMPEQASQSFRQLVEQILVVDGRSGESDATEFHSGPRVHLAAAPQACADVVHGECAMGEGGPRSCSAAAKHLSFRSAIRYHIARDKFALLIEGHRVLSSHGAFASEISAAAR